MEFAPAPRQAGTSRLRACAMPSLVNLQLPIRLRRLPAILCFVVALSSFPFEVALARTGHDIHDAGSFAELHARQPDRVFTAPAYSQRGQTVRHLYVSEEEFGEPQFQDPQVRYQPHVDGRDVDVWLAHDRVTVDTRVFRYADASTFEGETSKPHHPMYADLHVAPGHRHRPTMLCIESHPGDTDAGATDLPLFLLVDPLSAQARLYRLPGRLSSCAAVVAGSTESQPRFPAIRLLHAPDGRAIGARQEGWRIDGGRFVATGSSISATFTTPDDPSRLVFDAPAD